MIFFILIWFNKIGVFNKSGTKIQIYAYCIKNEIAIKCIKLYAYLLLLLLTTCTYYIFVCLSTL